MGKPLISPLTGLPFDTSQDVIASQEKDPPKKEGRFKDPFTGERYDTSSLSYSELLAGIDPYRSRGHESFEKYSGYNVPKGQLLDWNEIRAQNQSRKEKWLHGLTKAGITTAGAVAENTLGILFGLGEIATGGVYYDNAIGNAVDKMNEWSRENLPNYLTQEEMSMSPLEKMGTANFWADTVANGLGYSLGSIATGYLTGGTGIIGRIAGANKGVALYNTSRAVANGTKLGEKLVEGASAGQRVLSAAGYAETGLMMSLAEASVESREAKKQGMQLLVDQYLEENPELEHQNQIPKEVMEGFENIANSIGNVNMAMQLPVLAGTNLMMFGKQVAGFKSAVKANKNLRFDSVSGKVIDLSENASKYRKILGKLKGIGEGSAIETFQEGSQFFSKEFSVRYHTDKYANNGYGNMSKALSEALSETFGSNEGLESMLVGAIVGGIMGIGGAFNTKAASEEKKTTDTLKALINSGIFNAATKRLTNANAQSEALKRMQAAVKKGDIKAYKDAQAELIAYNALQIVQLGGAEVLEAKLAHLSEMPDAEFARAMNIDLADEKGNQRTLQEVVGQSQSEIIQDMRTKVKEVTDTYYSVYSAFAEPPVIGGLPAKIAGKERAAELAALRGQRESLKENLVIFGSAVKDRVRRMKNIEKELLEIEGLSLDRSDVSKALGLFSSTRKGDGMAIAASLDLQEEFLKMSEDLKNLQLSNLPDEILEAKTDEDRLKAIYKYHSTGRKDKIAAIKMTPLIEDYIALAKDVSIAMDSYNRLSSAMYNEGKELRKEAAKIKEEEDAAKEEARKKAFEENLGLASTETQLTAMVANEELDDEERAAVTKKLVKLREERNKQVEEVLKTQLKDAPTEEEMVQRAELLEEFAQEEGVDESMSDVFNIAANRLRSRAGIARASQKRQKKSEDDARERERLKEAESVQILDEGGRKFYVQYLPGMEFYNFEEDPIDAIQFEKSGEPVKIRLRRSNGRYYTLWKESDLDKVSPFDKSPGDVGLPEEIFDQFVYAILVSEAATIEDANKKGLEDIVPRKKAAVKRAQAAQKRRERRGYRGKYGQMSSSMIRFGMYERLQLAEKLMEEADTLRVLLLLEGKTREQAAKDPEMKKISKEFESLWKQVSAMNRVLTFRGDDPTLSTSENLEIEARMVEELEDLRDERERLYEEYTLISDMWEDAKELVEKYKGDPWVSEDEKFTAEYELLSLQEEREKRKEEYAVIKEMFLQQEKELQKHRNEIQEDESGPGSEASQGTAEQAQRPDDQGAYQGSAQAPEYVRTSPEDRAAQEADSFAQGIEEAYQDQHSEQLAQQAEDQQYADQYSEQDRSTVEAAKEEYLARLEAEGKQEDDNIEDDTEEEIRKEERKQEILSKKEDDDGYVEQGEDVIVETGTQPVAETSVSDIEGQVGTSNYSVDSGLIFYNNPDGTVTPVANPEGKPVMDVIIADIERRKQEEILNRKGKTISQSEVEKRFLNKRNEDAEWNYFGEKAEEVGQGNITQDTNPELYNELVEKGVKPFKGTISRAEIFERQAKRESELKKELNSEIKQEGLKRVTDDFRKKDDKKKFEEINAKYDAELAALESQSTSQASIVETPLTVTSQAEVVEPEDPIKGSHMDPVHRERVVTKGGAVKQMNRVKVSPQGEILEEYNDTIDGTKVVFDRADLNGDPRSEYELFLFENDWYKENYPKGSMENVPVAYGYRDDKGKPVYVGVLTNKMTPTDKKIRERLWSKKRVILPVQSVGASTLNNARTEGFDKVFYDPKITFEGTGMNLAFVSTEFDTGTKIFAHNTDEDLTVREPDGLTPGQVGFVIPGDMVPGGAPTVAMASTAMLTTEAKERALELIEQEDLSTLAEIVATIDPAARKMNEQSITFFEQGAFKDGLQYIVFHHAPSGELVRINSTELKKAMNGGKFRASVVRVNEKNNLESVKDYDGYDAISKDFPTVFKKFLDGKKFNVVADLAYTNSSYQSPVNPERRYGSYMEYLTSTEEMGGQEREEGQGHYSILSTDVVRNTQEGANPLFNNPDVTFGVSSSIEMSAEEVADAIPTKDVSTQNDEVKKLVEEDDMFKDEDC